MAAVGVANVIAQRLDFMVLVALIIGLVLIAIGYVVSKGKSTRDGMSKQKQNVRSTRLQALHS